MPRLVVLLDEAALLERGQQPRRRRLVQAEAAGELGHAGLALRVAEGQQQGRRPIDRADRVAVKDHRRRPRSQPAPGEAMPPCGVGAASPWARASRAAVERVLERGQDAVDDVALGVRLAHEPRLAGVRLGHRAAGVHADGDRVVQLVVGGRPVAVLGRDLLAEHDPEHRRVPGEVVRDADRVEDLAQPVLDAPAGGVDRLQGVGVAEDLERLDRGRGRDPVAGVRAAVADLVGQHAP